MMKRGLSFLCGKDAALLRVLAIAIAIMFVILPRPLMADLSGRLIIVTSFPENLFKRFTVAFEALHPNLKVHVRSKKTSAAISFIQDRKGEPVDVLWASAPDAFEVLKKSGHLVRSFDIPRDKIVSIANYPLDDPDGFYRGFAVSGYGIMWNRSYLSREALPTPRQWDDLRDPVYLGHLGVTAPSRSGTTHLIIETILQGKGWDAGWATLLEIGGNLATVTARSFGVLDGVRRGRFGAGPVIDFFGLSAIATGAPVGFAYPDATVFLPANIALVKGGENAEAARAFVDFILSPPGQKILLEPEISRLPVRAAAYTDARPRFPNPFDGELTQKGIRFDTELSRGRYHLVNALFDSMITFRLRGLTRAWKSLHEAEAALGPTGSGPHARQLKKVRDLLSRIPVTENQASNAAFAAEFVRRKPGLPVPPRQIELEKSWERFALENQAEALRISREVLDSLSKQHSTNKP